MINFFRDIVVLVLLTAAFILKYFYLFAGTTILYIFGKEFIEDLKKEKQNGNK